MGRASRKFVFPVLGLMCLVLFYSTRATGEGSANQSRIDHGRQLVRTHGCGDCHTPWKLGANGPEPDSSRLMSGHPQELVMPPAPPAQGPWLVNASATFTAWGGPWGVSFSKNLTPDKETGLGNWTEENFIETMRTGREMGKGRMLLPPMPWPSYQHLTDEELKSMYAYLMSIPVISNKIPDPVAPSAPEPAKK